MYLKKQIKTALETKAVLYFSMNFNSINGDLLKLKRILQYKIAKEKQCNHIKSGLYFASFSHQQFHQRVEDKAYCHAIGNTVCSRNEHDDQKCRKAFQ
jgi:hypothetical protein